MLVPQQLNNIVGGGGGGGEKKLDSLELQELNNILTVTLGGGGGGGAGFRFHQDLNSQSLA